MMRKVADATDAQLADSLRYYRNQVALTVLPAEQRQVIRGRISSLESEVARRAGRKPAWTDDEVAGLLGSLDRMEDLATLRATARGALQELARQRGMNVEA